MTVEWLYSNRYGCRVTIPPLPSATLDGCGRMNSRLREYPRARWLEKSVDRDGFHPQEREPSG